MIEKIMQIAISAMAFSASFYLIPAGLMAWRELVREWRRER